MLTEYSFAIVNQNNVANEKLYQYVLDETYEHTSKLSSNIEVYNTVDEAVKDSDGIVIIQHVGNFITDPNFIDYVDEYIRNNPDFFALAFTLDWEPEKGENYWIEIHGQMMVINTKVWRQLGCPEYGDWTDTVQTVPNYVRSEENFHDKYTPHWIQGTEGETERRVIHPGWGFLKAALKNKMRIDNFTDEMRKCRLYIYPEFESDSLYNAIEHKDESLVNNFNQKQYVKGLNNE